MITSAAALESIASGTVTTSSAVYVGLLGGPGLSMTLPAAPATTCPPIHPPVPPSSDLGGCRVLVILTGEVSGGTGGTSTGFMTVEIDNIALDTNSLRVTGGAPVRASVTVLVTGLTEGAHTFIAAYKRVGSGQPATFNARQITVIPA